MFQGVSKGKLFWWIVFFGVMTFSCFSVDTDITRVIGFIFLVVIAVMVRAIYKKASTDAGYRRISRELADAPELPPAESPTSSESSYFGPPPSFTK